MCYGWIVLFNLLFVVLVIRLIFIEIVIVYVIINVNDVYDGCFGNVSLFVFYGFVIGILYVFNVINRYSLRYCFLDKRESNYYNNKRYLYEFI